MSELKSWEETAFFEKKLADSLLPYLQAQHGEAPITIAILSTEYLWYVKALYTLWKTQSRPWHLVIVDPCYKERKIHDVFWQEKIDTCLRLPGMHRLDIEPYRFSLTLLFDESASAWQKISASICAFIVDGTQTIDETIWRMSMPSSYIWSANTQITLIEEQLKKHQMIAHITREETHAVLITSSHKPAPIPRATMGKTINIIGGGVAGAGIAYAMAQRGWTVRVYDPIFSHPDELAYRYSSGAVTPILTADDCHKARLSRAGVLRARARWKDIAEMAGIRYCGTLEVDRDKGYAKNLRDVVSSLNFPKQWVRLVNAQEASQLAGVTIHKEGVFFPLAMQISPVRLAHALLQHENIECFPLRITHITQENEQWVIVDDKGKRFTSVALVVANAMASKMLLEENGFGKKILKSGKTENALKRLESLQALSGEVMRLPASLLGGGPACVIGGQGYYLPAQEGYCVLGSTYRPHELHPQVSLEGQKNILDKMPIELAISSSSLEKPVEGRACVRAVVQGRLPIIAELREGLWLSTAYASHGMTWSSLAGEVVATCLEGEPLPIERDLFSAISIKA